MSTVGVLEQGDHAESRETTNPVNLTQGASGSTIQIPADVLASLLQSLHGLQSSITELKNENRGLQQALSSVETNVQKLQMHSGMEFALFPKLPLEIQRMIWGHTANIPKVIAVKRLKFDNEHDVLFDTYLAPVLPFYPQLRVCKEARHEVLKTALHLIHMYPFIIDAPQIFLNPWTDTLWLTTNLEVEFGEDDVDVLSGYYKLTISPSIHCLRVPRLALPWSLQLEEPLKYRIWV